MFVIAKAHDHLHIDRINMDGSLSTLTHMTSLKLQGPDVALHYDSDSRRVYWADHSAGLIESTDTNGYVQIFSLSNPESFLPTAKFL